MLKYEELVGIKKAIDRMMGRTEELWSSKRW
jgi:hypothetical protein